MKSRTAKIKVEEEQEEFPVALLKAFIKVAESDWSEKEHKAYLKQARKYIGDLIDDSIESGKLVVKLSKATNHLISDGIKKTKAKSKGKRAKKDA